METSLIAALLVHLIGGIAGEIHPNAELTDDRNRQQVVHNSLLAMGALRGQVGIGIYLANLIARARKVLLHDVKVCQVNIAVLIEITERPTS